MRASIEPMRAWNAALLSYGWLGSSLRIGRERNLAELKLDAVAAPIWDENAPSMLGAMT